MAPQWSTDEDRALLLALVQVMAPDGPSKNQMEAVIKAIDDRWTLGAATQHYNKKLRALDPATLGLAAGKDTNPSTPVRSSAAKKRKAPATTTTTTTTATTIPRTPRATAAAARTAIKAAASPSPSASPAPARDRKKKKQVVPRAVFPNLRESVSAAAPAASSADEDAEAEDEDDWEQREVPSKKAKMLEESAEIETEIEEGEIWE